MKNSVVKTVGIPSDLKVSPTSDGITVIARNENGRRLEIDVRQDFAVLTHFLKTVYPEIKDNADGIQSSEDNLTIRNQKWSIRGDDGGRCAYAIVKNSYVFILASSVTREELVEIIEAVVFHD